MKNILNTLQDFLETRISQETWYLDIKDYLKAVILYGSRAKGTNRPDSDIDLLFILPIEIEEKYTTGEYFVKYADYEFNIVMRSIEKLRKLAEGKHDAFQAEVFRDSIIVWEKDNEVKGFIENILKA